MLKYLAIFFLAICTAEAASEAGAVQFSKCTGIEETGKLWNMIIPKCTNSPCVFTKGQDYSIEFDFDNYRNTSSLIVEVYGIVSGVVVPWFGVDPDGCNNMLVGSCPLADDDYVTYGFEMKVDLNLPSIKAKLRWILKGDDQKAIFCCELPVELVT